jgi:hypothetical protein
MLKQRLAGLVPPHNFGGLEDHLEVLLLANVGDVDQTVGFHLDETVPDSSDVRGIVIVSSI